jgi:hypothetical protein
MIFECVAINELQLVLTSTQRFPQNTVRTDQGIGIDERS